MQAFHNNPELKNEYVARMRQHMEDDELVRGTYWNIEYHRGCAVGCTVKEKFPLGLIHKQLERELDIPVALFRLEDKLFETTPEGYYHTFALTFLEVIPVGADCSLVPYRFLHWLLVDPTYGVLQYAGEPGQVAIQHVADLLVRVIEGGEVSDTEWMEADHALFKIIDTDSYHPCLAARNAALYHTNINEASDEMVETIQGLWEDDPRWMDREDIRQKQAEHLLKLLREAPVH